MDSFFENNQFYFCFAWIKYFDKSFKLMGGIYFLKKFALAPPAGLN